MEHLQGPDKVIVKESPGRGLGCFARQRIIKGEIFEECHLIKVDCGFIDYSFNWPRQNPQFQVLPLGYGCIYNHSNTPNANWDPHQTKNMVFCFYALRDIEIGEEIFTYYGDQGYWNERSHTKVI